MRCRKGLHCSLRGWEGGLMKEHLVFPCKQHKQQGQREQLLCLRVSLYFYRQLPAHPQSHAWPRGIPHLCQECNLEVISLKAILNHTVMVTGAKEEMTQLPCFGKNDFKVYSQLVCSWAELLSLLMQISLSLLNL